MAARPMASGTVSFGLVAIPVKLFSTSDSSVKVSLNYLHEKCGSRVKYQYYCPTCDEEIGRDELIKGYEFAKGQYVLFSEEELKAMEVKPTHSIEITEFLPIGEVDPVHYDSSYYLGPDRGGEKPYRLLTEAMKETGRAAVAKYAARGKDYLVLLRPFKEGLIMQQLRYPDEIRAFSEVPLGDAKVDDSEMELATKLVDQISSEHFEPDKYEDSVRQQLVRAIEQKVEGQEFTAPPKEEPKAQIIDLMEALKKSLAKEGAEAEAAEKGSKKAAKASSKRKPAKRSPAKKSKAKAKKKASKS